MDIKVAATALVKTRSIALQFEDFKKVPGLHVENWLD